jgi:hypothetical protein
MTQIRTVIKEPGEQPRVGMLSNDLASMQAAVGGGLIEVVEVSGDVLLIVNEEGKFRNDLAPNVYAPEVNDVLVGPVLVVSARAPGGNFGSLSEDEAAAALRRFRTAPPLFV